MDPLFVGIVVLLLAGLGLIGYLVVQGRRSASRAVLDRVLDIHDTSRQTEALIEAPVPGHHFSFPTVERLLAGASFTSALMDALAGAGWHLKPSEFVGMSLASISAGAIVLTVLSGSSIGGVVGGVLGYAIPKFMLSSAAGRRKKALEAQIPDTVLLISSALKSGYSFLKALQVVAKEMPVPMSDVARKVVDECNFGVPLEDALMRMAARARSYDLDLVTTAVIIQSQVGGSLAEILDSIAETIRERIQIEAEISALTAEGKLSGIVLALMAPGMAAALTVLNPTYMSVLFGDPMGVKMVVAAVVLQIVGIIMIKKMMRVEV